MTIENKAVETQEVATTENQVPVVVIERETDKYVVIKEDGKFKRKAKYNEYSSIKPKNREEKIWLLNLMDGDEETGNGLKDHVGKQIEIENIILRPYDKINEETGQTEYGVLTYLINPAKQVFVTSSKSVYFSIQKMLELFGKPGDTDWENIKVQVGKEKGTNGDLIKVKMIG